MDSEVLPKIVSLLTSIEMLNLFDISLATFIKKEYSATMLASARILRTELFFLNKILGCRISNFRFKFFSENLNRKIKNPYTILDVSPLSVDHLFANEKLKRRTTLGVFGVADHEFDIRLPPRLGVRTRKVEKSVKFL
jgi:hypothetical protein